MFLKLQRSIEIFNRSAIATIYPARLLIFVGILQLLYKPTRFYPSRINIIKIIQGYNYQLLT